MSTDAVPSKQIHPSGQVDSEMDGVMNHSDMTTDAKSSLTAVPDASTVRQPSTHQISGLGDGQSGSTGPRASARSESHPQVQVDDHPSHHQNGSTITGGGEGHVPGHVHPSGIQVDVEVDGVEAEGTDRSHSHPHSHSQVDPSDDVQSQVQVQADHHVHHDGEGEGDGVGVGDHEPFDPMVMDAKAFWAALPIGDEHRPHSNTTTIDELERLVSENAHVHVHPIHSHTEETDPHHHSHHHHGHHHDVHHHHDEHNEHDPYGPYSPAPDAPSAPESSLLQQQGSNPAGGSSSSSSSGGQPGGQIRQGGLSANQMRQGSRPSGLRQTLPSGISAAGAGAGTGTGPDDGSSESIGGQGGQIRKLSQSEPIGSVEGENSGGVVGVRRRTSNGVANVQNKKDNHKNVEKKRREKINAGIEALANYLPQVEKNKSTILQKAAEYISHLKSSETTNCEKWAMEKMMMDQAISDLKSLVQAERHRRVDLEERVRLLEHELATETDKVATSVGTTGAAIGATDENSVGPGEIEGEDLSDRGSKRQRVDP